MQYRAVISEAWRLASHERKLLPYGMLPAFFGIVVWLGYALYQTWAFAHSEFFGGQADPWGFLQSVLSFVMGHFSLSVTVLVIALIGHFIIPPLLEGGLIGMITAISRGKDVQGQDGLVIGVRRFFKMFEYSLAISLFSFLEVFTVFSLLIRNFGPSPAIYFLSAVMSVFALFFFLMFIYARQFIVIEGRDLVQSFMSSAKMVFSNPQQTVWMSLLMLLIVLRVIVNVLLLFLVPAVVIFVTGFFAGKFALVAGVIVGLVVGSLALFTASYLTGVMHIFSTAAWTLTFLELDHERADKLLEK